MTTKTKAKPKLLEAGGFHWIATEGSILVHEVRAVVITIGVELKSQGSGWSHNWKAAHGRSQRLRKLTCTALMPLTPAAVTRHLRGHPTRISFTRLAPRRLDDDNLRSAFKPVRDQLVAWLAGYTSTSAKADDGMRSGYTFTYHQQQQRAHGVRIELSP